MRGVVCGGLVAMMMTMAATPVSAADFRPFSRVEDVCPTCPKRAEDTITLDNGSKVKAKIEAENEDYLVLSRYGEVRVIPKSRLSSVEWANNTTRGGLTSQDQIILRSGHVLTGSIVEEKETPGFYRLQSSLNQQIFVVFSTQIEAVYKAGGRVSR